MRWSYVLRKKYAMWSAAVLMGALFGVGTVLLRDPSVLYDVGRRHMTPVGAASQPLPTNSVMHRLPTAAPRSLTPTPRAAHPIVVENQQPGTGQWQLGLPGFRISDDATGQIKGYASATSVNQGQPITFYVSVNSVQTYTIDLYRVGWYGGLGARLLQHIGPLNGVQQPACPLDATTGLIACNWSASHSLTVPGSWTSGVFLAVLTNAQRYQNYILFVVRDDARSADLLYQQSVLTYQAYNNWPADQATGKSLIDDNSFGDKTIAGGRRAVKVSFDRPYSGNGAGQFLKWEIYFVRWLEQMGYDVVYTTDVDTHANGAQLRNYKGFLSVGHDAYWSRSMFDAVEAARDAGVHLGFFGANTAFWQVRLDPSASGAPNRVLICYKDKDQSVDPLQGSTRTTKWRSAPLNRPEQTLVGIQYTAFFTTNVAYVVTNSTHWVYTNSGFKDGDSVRGIVGYEADRYQAEYPLPKSKSYTLLSHSPFTVGAGASGYANSAIYQALSGAWVFSAGTDSWAWALGGEALVDPRIQRTTANVLNMFIGNPPE